MKVLGFRSDQNTSRYAIVSEDDGNFTLENASDKSRLSFPKQMSEDADAKRLEWLYDEIIAIFETHSDITKVVIKENDFVLKDTKSKRRAARYDAAVILACVNRDIPVEIKTYKSLSTTRKDTMRHAEERVGKTGENWDLKMADAVIAAWWGLCHP